MGVLKALCSQEMDTIRISKKVTNMRQTSIQMTWIVPKQPKEETWLPGSKMPHNAFLHTFIQSAQFLVTLCCVIRLVHLGQGKSSLITSIPSQYLAFIIKTLSLLSLGGSDTSK
jgi:hypothetical protein